MPLSTDTPRDLPHATVLPTPRPSEEEQGWLGRHSTVGWHSDLFTESPPQAG